MFSDSIPNASVAMATKDFAKKKRANRSAKLKQCKLDARREQWLSQVKDKSGRKEEVNGRQGKPGGSIHFENERRSHPIEKLEIMPRSKEVYGHHYSDSELSPSNSPISDISSILGSNDSGANFTGSSSRSSSSTSSNGSCSGTMSEEDEREDDDDDDDDGCLDNWEDMADALASGNYKDEGFNVDSVSNSTSPEKHVNAAILKSCSEAKEKLSSRCEISKSQHNSDGVAEQREQVIGRAWRPDDASRPQSLPNLLKQCSLPTNADRHFGCGGSIWSSKNVGAVPTSCPICCEDFDFTDSSFLPCSCGFRICLFCHKRILEDDGRCPGCRKQYVYNPVDGEATLDGGSLTFRLGRSCSMITRS